MKTVTINNFSGGIAQDERSNQSTMFSDCGGFDTSLKAHALIPYGETEADALSSGDITDKRISDITRDSSGNIYAVGRNSSGSPTVFDLISKDSATNIASTWTSYTSLSGAGGYRQNSLTFYAGKTYVIDNSFAVRRYDGSWSNVGSIDVGATWTNMLVPKPFIHPMDDILYMGGSQALAKIDSTTYSDISSVTVPVHTVISSFTDYGAYLAIATTPLYQGASRVFLWDRNTSTTTFSENISWGEDSLLILENIGGTLIGISTNEKSYTATSTYSTTKTKKLIIRAYQGGTPVVIKELTVPSTFSLRNYKQKVGEKLYFSGDYSDSLYVVYKDSSGRIIVSKDKYLNNGSEITTLRGFYLIDDYIFSMFDTDSTTGNIYRTKVTSSYTNTSFYESLINHSMDEDDRTKKKKLQFVSIAKTSTTGQLVVSVSVDGSAYQTVSTLSSGGAIVKKEARLASGSPFTDGYEFKFKVESTGGAEFTELKYAYEVVEKNI